MVPAPHASPVNPQAPKPTPGRLPASPPSRSSSRSVPAAANKTPFPPPLPLSHNPTALLNTIADSRIGKDGGTPAFDPIAFLNKHYSTEQSLAQQLPDLREAVHARITVLNTKIADAMQRQSETADSTRSAVQSAKSSVMELERRILQVKEKAGNSESAVLAITKDMKRLDCAKQQLQKTITALKRLHMLVQAVEQLRLTSLAAVAAPPVVVGPTAIKTSSSASSSSDCYKTASHLVMAIAQLSQHFEAYEDKVAQMKLLATKVQEYKEALRKSLVKSYRVTAFGYPAALLLDGGGKPQSKATAAEQAGEYDNDNDAAPAEAKAMMMETKSLDAEFLQGGTMYIDALGDTHRQRFIHEFCQDLLGEYLKKFEPPDRKPAEKRVSSFKVVQTEPENVQAGLDHIDKRFAWFQEVPLKIIKDRFPKVFPSHWNLQASLANMFLQLVRCSKGPGCCNNAFYLRNIFTVPYVFHTVVVFAPIRLAITFWPCSMDRARTRTRKTPPFCSRRYNGQ
jgi:vacuolar protein sorting-associated protein 53